MKKVFVILLIAVSIFSNVSSTKAMGTYTHQNGYDYIVYYRTTDTYYGQTLYNLRYSIVDVGFSSLPWTVSDATTIQKVWFSTLDNGKNTIVLTRFQNTGQPIATDAYSAIGLPPSQ